MRCGLPPRSARTPGCHYGWRRQQHRALSRVGSRPAAPATTGRQRRVAVSGDRSAAFRGPFDPAEVLQARPRIVKPPVNVKAIVTAHRYVTVRTVRTAPRPGRRCRRQSLRRADGSVYCRWWCAVPPHPWPCGPPHRRPLGPAIEGVRAPVCCSPPSTTAACHRATAPGRRRLRRMRAVVRRRSRPGLCHDRQAHRVAAVAAAQRRPVACQPRPSPPRHPREF